MVQAVDVWTCAPGGGYDVVATTGNDILLSSDRVTPWCFAAQQNLALLDKIKERQEVHCCAAYLGDGGEVPRAEREVLEFLRRNGGSSMSELRAALPEPNMTDSYLRSLRNRNLVAGMGPTSTDVLHAEGIYAKGSVEASVRGLEVVALSMGRTGNSSTERYSR